MIKLASTKTVVVDGVLMAVNRIGSGSPVVCLPAVGHDAQDFDPLAERCGDRFEFIRIEWPGHGVSGPDHHPASAQRYAELLELVLASLKIENPLIIGNSIGGAAAILYASRHPVRGLVLCDSGGLVEFNAATERFCRLFEGFFAAGERGAFWYALVFNLYYRLVLPGAAARAQRRRITKNARPIAPVLRQAWASFAKPDADLRELATTLEAPIWVAWAEQDRVIPLKLCLPAIRRLQNHTLSTFKAGHAPFLEQPDLFTKGFESFVARERYA